MVPCSMDYVYAPLINVTHGVNETVSAVNFGFGISEDGIGLSNYLMNAFQLDSFIVSSEINVNSKQRQKKKFHTNLLIT